MKPETGKLKLEIRRWKLGAAWLLVLLFPMVGTSVEGIQLVCDEPVYNFGRVDQSAVITNVFTVRNEGDLTYVNKYVRTSCSCTRGRLIPRIIGPGKTAKLTAVYKAIRRKGTQKKSLRLIPLDSNEPALVFYMEGFVEPTGESR